MTILIALLTLLFAAPAAVRTRRWLERTIITCNDDWASAGSNMAELLKHRPDFIFIQEGKRAHYAELCDAAGNRLFPLTQWGILQDLSTAATSGSVVIWRRSAFGRTGSGLTFAVRANGLLARYIAWVRGLVGSTRALLFSAHRPPVRARRWWKPFDVALWARLRLAIAAGRVVLGGMDSNEHGGPPNLPRSLKWVAVGQSIDGFVLSRSVRVVDIAELPYGTSDHHPVMATVQIPA